MWRDGRRTLRCDVIEMCGREMTEAEVVERKQHRLMAILLRTSNCIW